jgi:hypothetical protein
MEEPTLTKQQITDYILYVLHESNSAYDEIEWLIYFGINGQTQSICNHVTSLIKTKGKHV